MSLDISLYDEDENEALSMNWLRNPFGLCGWAEDNARHAGHEPGDGRSLHYVCNHWSYDDSKDVDRKLFLEVVMEYWRVIESLEAGYFFFRLSSYRQFIEPYRMHIPPDKRIAGMDLFKGERYADDGRLMLPVESLSSPVFHLRDPSLDRYKSWFRELVKFAEALQDESLTFYCSN